MNIPLIAVIGPTAAGKSDLAIKLAKEKNGEVISVDSRQVYRGLDIGSGKVIREANHPEPVEGSCHCPHFFSEGVRHHLLDVATPEEPYNITHFLRDARACIQDIHNRGKTPILCGGTHFWLQALLENTLFPKVPPNETLRTELKEKTSAELFVLLKEKDPVRAESIDPHNTIRLIRALEIAEALGAVPVVQPVVVPQNLTLYFVQPDRDTLRANIQKRLDSRLSSGMTKEVETLLQSGVSPEWLISLGLEYKFVTLFLQDQLTEQEMHEQLFFAIWHYAKRQLTWIRKMQDQGYEMKHL